MTLRRPATALAITIFSFASTGAAQKPAAPVLSTLYSFEGQPADGANPQAPVAVVGGVVYGVTDSGGIGCVPIGCGTVFSLTPPANSGEPWTETILYSFTGIDGDGSAPNGVVSGSGGVLYGTTSGGGATSTGCPYGCGTVFSLTPPATAGSAWTETVLHSFAGTPDGAAPPAGVVVGSGGVLYGTTSGGGTQGNCSNGCGTVFSLTPPASAGAPWTELILHSFHPNTLKDGNTPLGGVVIGSNGDLYGTTEYGGNQAQGTVFKLTPSQSAPWPETVLHNFNSTQFDGYYPHAGVAIGPGGVLYGTTIDGGLYAAGAAYSVTPESGGSWTEAVIYNFSGGSFPAVPTTGLVVGSGGVVYGTTREYGVLNFGTVYALKPPSSMDSSWTEVTLLSFAGKDGTYPESSLTLGANGLLYGATSSGGKDNFGTVFSLQP